MASISRTTELPGPISAAEALWYDLNRRPAFVVGFGKLVQVDGPWPEAGSRIVWDSPPPMQLPRGRPKPARGAVHETVDAYESRTGQTAYVEDEELRGTQVVSFAPGSAGQVRMTIAFDWELKEPSPVKDWVLVRRRVGETLRQTLVKYRIERIADLEDERDAAS